MRWQLSDRAEPRALRLANRHYNRQKPGTPQFVPPGSCLVLWTPGAVWVTSCPKFGRHQWHGAWMNTLFRKECAGLASEFILEAVAATREFYGEPPALGMVTFVDPSEVRHKRDPGRCYIRAGFKLVGETKSGLLAFQLLPEDMPAPRPPRGLSDQGVLFGAPASEPVEGDAPSAANDSEAPRASRG